MLIKDGINISSQWGIELAELKVLSQRAFLLIHKNGEKFVLKQKGNLEKVKNEFELLEVLNQKQLNVHLPLINLSGEYVVTYNQENYCLYKYFEGNVFSAKEVVQHHHVPRLLGETIAQLHKGMLDTGMSTKFSTNDLYIQVYEWALKKILKVDDDNRLKDIYGNLNVELKVRIDHLPKQLIHRDTHISNMIFKDDKLSGIIDFEIVEKNVRIFDVCYCSTSVLSEIFSDEKLRDQWFIFVEQLLREYNKINPLSELERNSVWHIMLAIQTVFMAYFDEYPSLFEVNKAMFLWIYESKSIIEAKVNNIF